MRSLWSSTNTKRTAPLSVFSWPAFHFCAARTVKSSSVKFSGILRSIQTRIWLEVSRSNCSSFEFRASARPPRTPARSVTYLAGFAGSWSSSERCASAAAATASRTRNDASREPTRPIRVVSRFPSFVPATPLRRHSRRRVLEVEVDRRRAFGARGGRLEVGLLLESEERGEEVRRKLQPKGVVALGRLVVPIALDRDPVLRPLELRLEVLEVRVRLQLRVSLDDHEPSLQRRTQLGLGRLALGGIRGSGRRVDLRAPDRSAGVHDRLERALLEVHGALDRGDEVGDQVRPALVGVLDVSPLSVHRLARRNQAVIGARHRNTDDHREDDDQRDASKTELPHGWPLLSVAADCIRSALSSQFSG